LESIVLRAMASLAEKAFTKEGESPDPGETDPLLLAALSAQAGAGADPVARGVVEAVLGERARGR
jgi:hypothetical protein